MTRVLVKLTVLLVIVAGLQLPLAGRRRLDPRVGRAQRMVATSDVLVFYDSVNYYSPPGDTDRREIAEMLDGELTGLRVGAYDHGAFQMGVYSAVVRHATRQADGPSPLFLVSINIRSFCPAWRDRPDWRFEELIEDLDHGGDGLKDMAFRAYVPFLKALDLPVGQASEHRGRYMDLPVVVDGQSQGTVAELSASRGPQATADALTLHYLYPITDDNERLMQLAELAELARKPDVHVRFFITPVNVQLGREVLGEKFERNFQANRDKIIQTLADRGCGVLDLSETAPPEWFHHGVRPNEHLNETGRRFVAAQLADLVRRWQVTTQPTSTRAASVEASGDESE